MFESILCQVTEYDPDVLESLIGLAVEIAREGREGRRVGTLFTLGDEDAVLARSRPLILDPLLGHPESARHISNPNLRGTIKELAQLDGGFVVSHGGIVLSPPAATWTQLRHMWTFQWGLAAATLQPPI